MQQLVWRAQGEMIPLLPYSRGPGKIPAPPDWWVQPVLSLNISAAFFPHSMMSFRGQQTQLKLDELFVQAGGQSGSGEQLEASTLKQEGVETLWLGRIHWEQLIKVWNFSRDFDQSEKCTDAWFGVVNDLKSGWCGWIRREGPLESLATKTAHGEWKSPGVAVFMCFCVVMHGWI